MPIEAGRPKQKKHVFARKRAFCFADGALQSTRWEPKKAASLAIDDWLVFARRGLKSRVQAVIAG
jgi:hypothetical protein